MDKNLLELIEESPYGIPGSIKNYVYQMLKACDYCHRQNVVHRDIKPENLLIDIRTNKMKVCDLGFARQVQS